MPASKDGKRIELNKSAGVRHTFPGTKTNLATDCAWEPAIYQIQRAINEKRSSLSKVPFATFYDD